MGSSDDFDAPLSKRVKKSNETPPAENAVSTQILAENSSSSTSNLITTIIPRLQDINSHGQANAVNQIRDLLLNNNDLLIKLKNEIIPYLIESMKKNDLKAAWILANLATVDFQLARIIIDGGAFQILIQWLASPNFANQAILAIKTVVDAYKDSNEIKAMIVMQHIRTLAHTIAHSDQQIQANAIYIFQNVMSANMIHIEKIMESGAVVLLINFLSPQYMTILEPVLLAIRSFLAHGAYTCAYCVQKGILEALSSLTEKFVGPSSLLPVVSTINILCQHYCTELLPESSLMLLRRLVRLIFHSNADILIQILHSISFFSPQQINDFTVIPDVYNRFVELIKFQDLTVSNAAMNAFGNIINGCFSKMEEHMIRDVVTLMSKFLQHHDSIIQKNGLSFLCKVSKDKNKVEWIVSENLIQEIVKLLYADLHVIEMMAANIIKDISCGTKDQRDTVVQAHCICPLIRLSTSVSLDVRIAALSALANITLHYRDACLQSDIIKELLILKSKDKSSNLMKSFARVLFNLLQDPIPAAVIVIQLFPCLQYFIKHAATMEDILFTLRTLSRIAKTMPKVIHNCINKEDVPRLVDLLKHRDDTVRKATLDVFDSMSGIIINKRHLINCGVLKHVNLLLTHTNETTNIISLKVLSKLATGTASEIQAMIEEENLISILADFLKTKSFAVKKETINFFSTIAANATAAALPQLLKIFNIDLMTLFFEIMMQYNSETVNVIPMLQAILDVCKKCENSESTVNEFWQRIYASNGHIVLCNLSTSENNEIRVFVNGFIRALNIPLRSVTDIT